MLDETTREIIRNTRGALAVDGLSIAKKMYARLENDPQVGHFFKNSVAMSTHLPKALATVILEFIDNIDDITPMAAKLRRISAVHTLHGVKAEDYKVVGRALLLTIEEVLCPDEAILTAWYKAYIHLVANIVSSDSEWKQLKNSS